MKTKSRHAQNARMHSSAMHEHICMQCRLDWRNRSDVVWSMLLSDASAARCCSVLILALGLVRNMQQWPADVKMHAGMHMLRSACYEEIVRQRKSHAVRGWPCGRMSHQLQAAVTAHAASVEYVQGLLRISMLQLKFQVYPSHDTKTRRTCSPEVQWCSTHLHVKARACARLQSCDRPVLRSHHAVNALLQMLL